MISSTLYYLSLSYIVRTLVAHNPLLIMLIPSALTAPLSLHPSSL
jgi:hypothetical protein